MSIDRNLLPSVLGALLLVLTGACVTKEFDHGTSGGANDTFESAPASASSATFGESGAFGFPEGNYPDPAVSRCGDVLGDLPAINSLTSAWAVVAVPNATAGNEPVETGSVLIRLSQQALVDCGSEPESQGFFGTSTGGGLHDGPDRGLDFLLPAQDVTLGVHTLSTPNVTLYGDGATSEFGTEATVELLRIDDNCIIGVVRGVQSLGETPFMEGGFVAETCQRQCIPTAGFSC